MIPEKPKLPAGFDAVPKAALPGKYGKIQKTNVLEITGNRVAYKIQWGIKKW